MSNGLDVAFMKDPYGDWSPEIGDRHTDIAFTDSEWGSFFFNTLGAVKLKREYGVRYDDAFNARDRLTFQASLKKYPLLARIEEFYRDSYFAADEIDPLQDELRRVEQLVLDDDAKVFLDGMLAACKTAESLRMGIRLLSS